MSASKTNFLLYYPMNNIGLEQKFVALFSSKISIFYKISMLVTFTERIYASI